VLLLVADDRSAGARDALELARVLCAATGSSAVGFDAPSHGEEGSAAEAIIRHAAEGGFDAIVTGSPHRHGLGRMVAGSVAVDVLNGAETDVFVAPAGYADSPHDGLKTIAIAYLGTPESDVARQRGEELVPDGGQVELMTVAEPPVALSFAGPNVAVPEDPEAVLSEGLSMFPREMAVETRHLNGAAAPELEKACAAGIDLLVMGSRGYGPVKRVLLGSVSGHVFRHAPCPLLVTRRP
jgi:nucleotide-binding universal stress UspA family protein